MYSSWTGSVQWADFPLQRVLPDVQEKTSVFWDIAPVVCQKLTYVSKMLTASIIALMIIEAASASETSENYKTTRYNVPIDSLLHTPDRENLKPRQTEDLNS
jgi:hypothetical protein